MAFAPTTPDAQAVKELTAPKTIDRYYVQKLEIEHMDPNDPAGLTVYIRWLEDLRLQVMTEHYPLQDLLDANQSPILEKTEITYHQPLRLFEEVVGRMWVSKLSKARWQIYC